MSKPETFYKCKSEVYKWIVTTSFENVLAVINDCLKVNYFDLIEALRDKEIITLSQLIEAIRLDYIIRKYQTLYDNSSIEIKRAMESFGFPIKMNCSKFYNPIIQLKSK